MVKKLKNFFKEHKKLSMGLRFLFIYLIFLAIAKYTTIYETGVLSNNVLSIFVIAVIWIYRFLSYTIVPIIFFFFVVKIVYEKVTLRK